MREIISLVLDLAFICIGFIGLLHGWHIEDIYEEVAGGALLIYGQVRAIGVIKEG